MKKSVFFFLFIITATLSFGETFRFRSDSLKSIFTEGREKTLLIGNVKIESEKRVIKAQRVELWGDNYRYFSGEGDIFVFDKEKNFEVTANSFFYDKKEDIMRLRKNILMQDYKNEMVIKAGFIENRGAEEKIFMQVGVVIQKEDILCNSEFALYSRDDEFLELEGMPVVYKDGDTFKAELITVDLKTDNIILSGNVSGKLEGEDNKKSSLPQTENSSKPDSGNKDEREEGKSSKEEGKEEGTPPVEGGPENPQAVEPKNSTI